MATVKKVKKAQTGKKLPVKRVREISDSLMKESKVKKETAGMNERIANSQKKYIGKPIDSLLKSPGWGGVKKLGKDARYATSEGKLVTYPGEMSPETRLAKAQAQRKSASADSSNAVRYRKLADKAEGKKPSMKKGGKVMLKRADGSYSQRGLWDNIRAAKGSGKKPTAQMLKQEKKIKAQYKKK